MPAVTVSQVDGISVKPGHSASVAKTKLEIMVPDELVGPVMGAIQANAYTGKSGDGCIFAIPIAEALKFAPVNARSRFDSHKTNENFAFCDQPF